MSERFRLDKRPLSPALVEKAKRELRETPEQVKESVAKLREILRNDKTLHFSDDEEHLIRYLRPTKYYPESAHALIKRVAEFKEKHKNILADLLPEHEKTVLQNEDIFNVLVDRDQDGRRILLMKEGSSWDPSKATADQKFRLLYLAHLVALLEPATQVNGIIVIMDFDGLGMKHVTALPPTALLRLLAFIQDALPLRLKQVHIVNQPMIFNMLWAIVKPVLKEKMKKRIHFHGSKMASLHEHVKPENLPANYGGKLPAINYTSKEWYPQLEELSDYIRESNKYGLVKK